jgi:SAM-dependent methyltransferase
MTFDPKADQKSERARYDLAGLSEVLAAENVELLRGGEDLAPEFRPPYEVYDRFIAAVVTPGATVLELGAGGGRHTVALTAASRRVIALDVSELSLKACSLRTHGAAMPVCGTIEELPVADATVDVVASAGSLSYGDPTRVNSEVFRVLRPGGSLVVVDSLNHNPVYRANRWLHYRRGERTKSTLLRMPDLARMRQLAAPFADVQVYFHGSYLFLQPALRAVLGTQRALDFNVELERRFGSHRNAFKFVLVGTGFQGQSRPM